MTSETDLVDMLKNKHPLACEMLYDRYAASLYSVIIKLTPDKVTAAAVLEKSFILFWHQIAFYESSKSKFFPWMLGIAIKQCIQLNALSFKEVKEKLGISILLSPATLTQRVS